MKLLLALLLSASAYGQVVNPGGGGGGGATIPNTTNLISGSGTGNGADSGIAPANVAKINTTNTWTSDQTYLGNSLMGTSTRAGNPTGGAIRFNGTAVFPTAELLQVGFTFNSQTSGNIVFGGVDNVTFAPPSGTANFAGWLVSPVINGTSSGTAYGSVVAPITNTLTGGTVKLQSWGTATGVNLAGYSEKAFVSLAGGITGSLLGTTTNCSSAASPAVCAAAASGSVSMPTGSTLVVNTTAVTANSQIQLTYDSSLGTRLGVTCDTTPGILSVSARTAGTSFTISSSVPATTAGCISYTIIN